MLTKSEIEALKKEDKLSLTVFAITPVQDFIAKARKLRDYWTGSVLLSYLSFWGIKTVCEELGSDCIVYPSLNNQSLVDATKKDIPDFKKFITDPSCQDSKEIAAFPNKFVYLCPTDEVDKIYRVVSSSINDKWIEIGSMVKSYLKNITSSGETFDALWKNQIDTFWKYSYGSCRYLKVSDKEEIARYLSEDKWLNDYNEVKTDGTAELYGATHSLAQSILAAGKMKPTQIKSPQSGEKCPLCGEHEILHNFSRTGQTSAKEYSESAREFWQTVRDITNKEDDFVQTGEKERLCAVCAVKRYLPMIISKKKDHILYSVFSDYKKFPSTTEMALYEKINNRSDSVTIAQKLHENELSLEEISSSLGINSLTDRDKYYAFILMDGDKMGDLINGEILKDRITDDIHKKISDALNDFARQTVYPIISATGGRLIYAGGDDVCAIVPLDKALDAVQAISEGYAESFSKNKLVQKSDERPISISGGITIAHHKQPLKEIITGAHSLLDAKAKDEAGRNALAIRLKKRSGGDRDFAFKWNEPNPFMPEETKLDSFKNTIKAVEEGKMGQSLLYRIETLREVFEPVKNDSDKLFSLLMYEVSHSGKWGSKDKEKLELYTKYLAGICFNPSPKAKNWFTPEAAIIACFMAHPNDKEIE